MDNNYIKGIVDRVEEQRAVISLDDGQKLIWPIEKLPPNCTEGSVVKLILLENEIITAEDGEKNLLAKNILNEILDVEDKEL